MNKNIETILVDSYFVIQKEETKNREKHFDLFLFYRLRSSYIAWASVDCQGSQTKRGYLREYL